MPRPSILVRFATAALAALLLGAGPALAAKHQDRDAEAFVQDISDKGIAIIDQATWSTDRKRTEFRNLMSRHIAFRFFGRSALGPFARVPSTEQFNAYVELLKDYAAYAMQSQLNEYVGKKVRVLSSKVKESGRLAYVAVESEVFDRASGRIEGSANWLLIRQPRKAEHSAASGDGATPAAFQTAAGSTYGYKVFDLTLQTAGESASFSLLQTQRDEFTAILSRNNRDFDELLEYIRIQIKKIQESK